MKKFPFLVPKQLHTGTYITMRILPEFMQIQTIRILILVNKTEHILYTVVNLDLFFTLASREAGLSLVTKGLVEFSQEFGSYPEGGERLIKAN